MTSRLLLLATAIFLAASATAPAADLCRFRTREHGRIGNEPSTPTSHTPRKRIVGAQAVTVHAHNRGKYPYVGKRATPKRTYVM